MQKSCNTFREAELVVYFESEHGISTRNACRLFIINSSGFYYKKKKNNEDDKIREELVLLAEQHQRGFWTMHHRLRNLGFGWNHKRVYMIYKSMKLNLRSKRKKRLSARVKEPLLRPIYPIVMWSMDLCTTFWRMVSVRSFNIIDDFNRVILDITIDANLASARVVLQSEQLIDWRVKLEKVRVDAFWVR